MLPRLPLVEKAEDFWAFSRAGRELADLHLNYEELEPTEGVLTDGHFFDGMSEEDRYRVTQMKFAKRNGKEKDRSVIEYNTFITVKNIPQRRQPMGYRARQPQISIRFAAEHHYP